MTHLRRCTTLGVVSSLLAAAAFVVLPPGLSAEPPADLHLTARSWNTPVQVTRHASFDHAVGIADDGTTAAVWSTRRGVHARLWTRDDGWRPPVRLGPGSDLALSVNAQGAMAVSWLQASRDKYLLRVSRRAADGTWTRPATLFRGTTAYGTDSPDVSVGPGGRVTVAVSISRRYFRVPARPLVFTYADGRWGRPVALARKFAWDVQVATGPDGHRAVAWSTSRGGWCAARSGSSSWSRPVCAAKPRSSGVELDIDSGGRAYLMTTRGVWSSQPGSPWRREPVPGGPLHAFDDFSIGLDASSPGRAAIVWEQGEQTSRTHVDFTMFASSRRPDGSWTPRTHLSDSSQGVVGISHRGTSYAAWVGRQDRLRISRKEPGQPWVRPSALVRGANAASPTLAVNGAGVGVVVFSRGNVSTSGLWASRRP